MAAADAVLMLLGFFVLAVGFKVLTVNAQNVSSLWLANGFALGMLLTSSRRHWPLLLFAAAAGGAGSAWYLHANPAVIPWIAGINAVEVLVAASLLHAHVRSAGDLTARANFLRFLGLAVGLAPLAMVGLLSLYNMIGSQGFDALLVERVLIGHVLGIAIMTPVTLALRTGEASRYLRPDVLPETVLTLAALAGITTLVFYQSALPLLFLIFPPMMRVAYRGGFVGTAMALLVVVTIGAIATAGAHGPIAATRASEKLADFPLLADGFVLLQIFVGSLLISLFPMIVSIAEGERAHRATDELQNRLRLLMEHSSDVITLTDLDGRRLYVSPAVRDVVGIDPEHFLNLTWRDHANEADQLIIATQIEEAQNTRTSRMLVFRTTHASGKPIWIEAHMKYFRDRAFVLMQTEKDRGVLRNCGPDGDEGFVVTMRDISARRQVELELESANAELASLVRKDSLTGLANRRRFDEGLQEAWTRALAGGWPIAVLMIDVDHFKQFNDCYGHQRGDMCLRDVALAISSGLFHPDDLAARYGGEEFAIILPNTSTESAARVAERIRNAVQDIRRPHIASPSGALTVSIGVAAAFPVPHGDPAAVVNAADQALYTSKHEGRNRTTLLDVTWSLDPDQTAPAAAG